MLVVRKFPLAQRQPQKRLLIHVLRVCRIARARVGQAIDHCGMPLHGLAQERFRFRRKSAHRIHPLHL